MERISCKIRVDESITLKRTKKIHEGIDWIRMSLNRNQWLSLKTLMNLLVPQKAGSCYQLVKKDFASWN